MKPSYTLTAPAASDGANFATKPRQVDAWLAGLPGRDTLEQVDLLAEYLARHDRPDLPAAFRRQLLDMAAPTINDALHSLEGEFREMPLPLPEAERGRVDAVTRLLLAIGGMNKRLILEFADYSPRLFGSNPLPAHIAGFLRSARQLLDICYASHSQVPVGLWRDLNQTASLLFSAKLVDTPDPAESGMALGGIYCAILLEAVADPYHFSSQERLWIRDVIARFGHLAKVEDAKAAHHKGIYGVRVSKDRAPYPLAWQQEAALNCELVLNTAALARRLASLISQLDQGRDVAEAIPLARYPAYKSLLLRLKLLWGGSMRRTSARRVPARAVQNKVMLGFNAIHRRLVGSLAGLADNTIADCELENESRGGIALRVQKPDFHLRIGTLVHVGQSGDDGFDTLGLVRWFRVRSDGALTFGIKFMLGCPTPITVFPADGRHVYPGLLLLSDANSQHLGSVPAVGNLILPLVRMAPGAKVEIRLAGVRHGLSLVERVDGSDDVEVFRYQLEEHGKD